MLPAIQGPLLRRQERLEQLADSLKDEAGKVVVYAGDVSKKEVCEGMIDECVKQLGRLDVLVNNAGIMDNMAAVANFLDEKYEAIMAVNVDGYGRIQGFQALMPAMGEPIDVASTALFLASDESSFISGQIIGVDGGWEAV